MNDSEKRFTIEVETIPNAMFSYKESLYFSDSFSNGLFRFEPDNKRAKCIGEFRNYEVFNLYLYNSVVITDTRAFFIPYNANSIALFEIEKNLLKDIKLPIEIRNKKEKFFVSTIVGNKIYMFGYRINDIYVFEINSGSYSKIKLSEKILKIIGGSKENGLLVRDVFVIENVIYFSSIYQNYIFRLDSNNDQITTISIPIKNKGIYFMTLEPENQNICMVPTDGSRLVFFEVCTGDFVEKVIEEQNIEVAFSKPLYYNKHFYMMPCWGNQPICINAKTYEIVDHDFIYDILKKTIKKEYINGIKIGNYIIYIANSGKGRNCLICNCKKGDCGVVKIIAPRKIKTNVIRNPINEADTFKLEDYLKMLI